MNILLLAPPAAGKGTHSSILVDKYNMSHISSGDLLRKEIKLETDIGLIAKDIVKTGSLVADELITEVVINKINTLDKDVNYILDGYPRTKDQAVSYNSFLEENNLEKPLVIVLEHDYNEILERILSRFVCSNCGKIYNLKVQELTPRKPGICDVCGSILIKRTDDDVDVFKKRYDEYENVTKKLIDYYSNEGNVYIVNSGDISETAEEISRIIKEYENEN